MKISLLKRLTYLVVGIILMTPQLPPVEELEPALPPITLLGTLAIEWPIADARVTSVFGLRSNIRIQGKTGGGDSIHRGIDLIPPKFATVKQMKQWPILAAEVGVVSGVYPPPGGRFKGHPIYGGCVEIKHLVGVIEGQSLYVYTFYGHMKEVWVRSGQQVTTGQMIGIMGSTGLSSGPHLHFEVLFDPRDFLVSPEKRMQNNRRLFFLQKGYE